MKTHIALFCSGGGSNAQAIMRYFAGHPSIEVTLLAANKNGIGALQKAEAIGVETWVFDRKLFYDHSDAFVEILRNKNIHYIILAGFLWQLPPTLVQAYDEHILNIHPALLPKFGGKGMFGHHVHAAVLAAGEKQSGMTVHLVNEDYDAGKPIFQAFCPVYASDTVDTLAGRVLQLEHTYYPTVVEAYIEFMDTNELDNLLDELDSTLPPV